MTLEFAAAVENGVEVDIDDAQPVFVRRIFRRYVFGDAGVVGGDVDAAVGGFDLLCDLADAGGIRQIPLKELDAEFYGGFIAFLLVDIDDDDAPKNMSSTDQAARRHSPIFSTDEAN